MKKILPCTVYFLLILFSYNTQANSVLQTYGNIGQIALPALALTSTLFYQDEPGAIEFAKSFLATEATVYILKPVVNRRRPNGGTESFPSGHTASAFAGAAFLQMRYGWAWGVPAYLAAGLVGYSRIEGREHWTSDVLAGAAIAVGWNALFDTRYKNMMITPTLGANNTMGIEVSQCW